MIASSRVGDEEVDQEIGSLGTVPVDPDDIQFNRARLRAWGTLDEVIAMLQVTPTEAALLIGGIASPRPIRRPKKWLASDGAEHFAQAARASFPRHARLFLFSYSLVAAADRHYKRAFQLGRSWREEMRCYMMRRGGIASVDFLDAGPDEALVQQAAALFKARKSERFDGFEVWDGARRVHVYPSVAAVDVP